MDICSSLESIFDHEGKSYNNNVIFTSTTTDHGFNRVKNVDANGQMVYMSFSIDTYKARDESIIELATERIREIERRKIPLHNGE